MAQAGNFEFGKLGSGEFGRGFFKGGGRSWERGLLFLFERIWRVCGGPGTADLLFIVMPPAET